MSEIQVKGTFNVPPSMQNLPPFSNIGKKVEIFGQNTDAVDYSNPLPIKADIPVDNVSRNAVPTSVQSPLPNVQQDKPAPKITCKGEYMVPDHLVDILMPNTPKVAKETPVQTIGKPIEVILIDEEITDIQTSFINGKPYTPKTISPKQQVVLDEYYVQNEFYEFPENNTTNYVPVYVNNDNYYRNKANQKIARQNLLQQLIQLDRLNRIDSSINCKPYVATNFNLFDNLLFKLLNRRCNNRCNCQNYYNPYSQVNQNKALYRMMVLFAYMSQMFNSFFNNEDYFDEFDF